MKQSGPQEGHAVKRLIFAVLPREGDSEMIHAPWGLKGWLSQQLRQGASVGRASVPTGRGSRQVASKDI